MKTYVRNRSLMDANQYQGREIDNSNLLILITSNTGNITGYL